MLHNMLFKEVGEYRVLYSGRICNFSWGNTVYCPAMVAKRAY